MSLPASDRTGPWRAYYRRYLRYFVANLRRGKKEPLWALGFAIAFFVGAILVGGPIQSPKDLASKLLGSALVFLLLLIYHALEAPVGLDAARQASADAQAGEIESLKRRLHDRQAPHIQATLSMIDWRAEHADHGKVHQIHLQNVGGAPATSVRVEPIDIGGGATVQCDPVSFLDARNEAERRVTVFRHGAELMLGRHNLAYAVEEIPVVPGQRRVLATFNVTWNDQDGAAHGSRHEFAIRGTAIEVGPA